MKGHRVWFCAFFNQSNINNDVTTFATGENKHESDERNANKAGRRHQ